MPTDVQIQTYTYLLPTLSLCNSKTGESPICPFPVPWGGGGGGGGWQRWVNIVNCTRVSARHQVDSLSGYPWLPDSIEKKTIYGVQPKIQLSVPDYTCLRMIQKIGEGRIFFRMHCLRNVNKRYSKIVFNPQRDHTPEDTC